MSAFLFYSIGKRQKIKQENPEMKNTDVSRILGQMWRSLSAEERQPFVDRERSEREKYKIALSEWKEKDEARKSMERKRQAELAEQAAEYHAGYGQPYGVYSSGYMPQYGTFS